LQIVEFGLLAHGAASRGAVPSERRCHNNRIPPRLPTRP
jgi:hypothetical protein